LATQPPPETPNPSEPAQPTQAPPEIVPPGHDIDQPDPGPAQTPDIAPGQPTG
jgi:hypothetical protein